MAPRGEPVSFPHQPVRSFFDWITYHTVVSTSDDQIAIAPGYLQRDWKQNGRALLRVQHGFHPYCWTSSRIFSGALCQSVKRSIRGPNGPVNLEVYYDPAHTFDIDDMLASSRAGLDYYQGALQPLPVHPIPDHGVSALPLVRAIFSQHGAVL